MIIGIFLRHIKAYKGIKYVPIGEKYNFASYIGENGVGKSSILQGLNAFFNDTDYPINKSSLNEGNSQNFPYFTTIFLIQKDKIPTNSTHKQTFESLSNYFWNVTKSDITSGTAGAVKEFFDLRSEIPHKRDSYYLLLLGEKILHIKQPYFGSFHRDIKLMELLDTKQTMGIVLNKEADKDDIDKYESSFDALIQKEYKTFFRELKEMYSYVYIPVEIDVENFTKIERNEMQKIFDKKIKDEIGKMIKVGNINEINNKLDEFTDEIEKILDYQYFYDTGNKGKKALTSRDLVEKILETYFQIRVLNKGITSSDKSSKKISELSAGEKRQALIDVVYAFLKKDAEREKSLIIGIDEPENSLHTSLCYDQFEKLKEISKNNQILITTHWYGFLPVIDKGFVHFLKSENQAISFFNKMDLYSDEYKTKNIPEDFSLKSTNDLIQSIFHSLKAVKPYNWLICEGASDKIYLNKFLHNEIANKNLRIIAVGGVEQVKKFYKYLELPISENVNDLKRGKVFCLTDTDNDHGTECKTSEELKKILTIQRFYAEKNNIVSLIKFDSPNGKLPVDIEKSLNPLIFKKTLDSLNVNEIFLINELNIQNIDGNTSKENLRSWDIDNYFSSEEIKNTFADKYVEILSKEQDENKYTPQWVKMIKDFFN